MLNAVFHLAHPFLARCIVSHSNQNCPMETLNGEELTSPLVLGQWGPLPTVTE